MEENMKTISIGGEQRDLESVTGGWIQEHVRALQSRGMAVCVQVRIKSGPIDIAFATPGCGPSRPADREPNPDEERILNLWRKRGLNHDEFDVGQLVAFVKEVKHA